MVSKMMPAEGRITASPIFAFYLGFDRVVQDDTYGFYSGRRNPVIIATALTPDENRYLEKTAPKLYDYRRRLLAEEYETVFEIDNLRVLRKRSSVH